MPENQCPKCKNIIKPGNVYCEKCGYEIQMVPVFDAEMDDTISKMLEGINLEEMSEEEFEDFSKTLDITYTDDIRRRYRTARTKDLLENTQTDPLTGGDTQDLEESAVSGNTLDLEESGTATRVPRGSKGEGKRSRDSLIKMLIAPAVLLVIVLLGLLFYNLNPPPMTAEGYIKKGNAELDGGDSQKAMEYYKSALELDPLSDEAAIGVANAMYAEGDFDGASAFLLTKIEESPSELLYGALVNIYQEQGESQRAAELIQRCEDEDIRSKFDMFIAKPPTVDMEEGEYEKELEVRLFSDSPGTIYYTLDGSEPDTNSKQYEGAIKLGIGNNVLRAVFVNELGIMSPSMSAIYDIGKELPDAPIVTPESGSYEVASYVEVEPMEGYKVYYTTDDTMPDEESTEYKYPLLMPMGSSTFKFVAVDDEGNFSTVTSVKYDLNMTVNFSESQALNSVKLSLIAAGRVMDVNGDSPEGRYGYSCMGMLTQDGFNYYIIEEKLAPIDKVLAAANDPEKIKSAMRPTGELFTVEATLGVTGHCKRNSEGYFVMQ